MASAKREPNGGMGWSPQRGPWAKNRGPCSGVLAFGCHKEVANMHSFSVFC